MPIRAFLTDGSAFDPVDLQCMSIALHEVCKALKLSPQALEAKQIIAERIIELARRGERDPFKLRNRLLREAGEQNAI